MKKMVLLLWLAVVVFPAFCAAGEIRQAAPKVSFDFIDADIRNVLRVIAEVSGKNMVIADEVKGKITIKLDSVSSDEALEVILKNNDLAKVDEERLVRVMTSKKFYEERARDAKDRLDFFRERQAQQKLEQELVTETVYINYADLSEVEKMIRGETSAAAKEVSQGLVQGPPGMESVPPEKPKGLLSPNGVVTAVKWNSALIIKDTKENVAEVVRLIKQHDVAPKQVQIEARIVQATSTFSKELGIQWGASYQTRIGGTTVGSQGARQVTGDSSSTSYTSPTGNLAMRNGVVQFPYNVNLPANVGAGQGGTLGIYVGGINDSLQLDLVLSALEAQGRGKVISSPKIVTSENRPARITQGTEIPYQSSSAQLGTNILFKLAVLELEVVPRLTKDGNIRMTIKAKKDEPNFDTRFPVPAVTKREAVTELLVKDGETVVLGGIYEATREDDTGGLPFLKDVPLLGWLFKHTAKTDNKTELLVFVTPRILKDLYAKEGNR